MKPLIQFVEGRTFLEEHGWDIAMANFHKDPDLADQLLYQIDNEIDRAYCQGAASALLASISCNEISDAGIDVPEEEPLTLH